jgi:hypothetical protein
MREIKFRAKDIDTGEWRYGYYVRHEVATLSAWGVSDEDIKKNTKHYIMYDGWADWNMKNPWHRAEVDGSTLGQWVWLKDRDNVDIYEGDRYIFPDRRKKKPDVYTVDSIQDFLEDKGYYEAELGQDWGKIRVIGNIYE